MIVNFVGSPCSGKTTTAASLFAKLKEDGHNAEFLTEQARLHIASKRFLLRLKPEESLVLDDMDQQNIMFNQLHYETMLQDVCGPEMTIITDSSFLNAILYMTEEAKTHFLKGVLEKYVEASQRHPRIIFVCPVVKRPLGNDPNRVHSEEQSLAVHAKIPEILEKYAPGADIVNLDGNPHARYLTVLAELLKRLTTC